jgi:3-hydroxyisobutyrate dehydrogenase-like beta-hydroxyacid dehydrogenase
MANNFLLAAEKTQITEVLDYLDKAGLEKPAIDETATDKLAKNHSTFGYPSEILLREDLRDRPVATLLRIILYLNVRT